MTEDLASRRGRLHLAGLAYTLFVLVLLLAPAKNLQLYYVLVTLLIVAFSVNRVPRAVNRFTAPLVVLTGYVLFGALLRSIAFRGGNLRDYLEVMRLVPVILVYATPFRWRGLRLEHVLDAALIYVLLDGVISFCQFTGIDPFGVSRVVSTLYSASWHYERSLGLSDRALGLSPGPGQHGATLFLLSTLLLYGVFAVRRRSFVLLCGWLVAMLGVLLSQSQTAFVVTGFVAVAMLLYFLARGARRERRIAGISLLLLGGSTLFLVSLIAEKLRYLFTLFVYGLGRSSYQNRLEKWGALLSHAFEQPWWLPLGWGKDYFGSTSAAMDSDLVYIFCVYGGVIFLAFSAFVLHFVGSTLRRMIATPFNGDSRVVLFFIVLGGVIFSWPNAFFTSPNILLILAIIHASWWWTQRPAAQPDDRFAGRSAARRPSPAGTGRSGVT